METQRGDTGPRLAMVYVHICEPFDVWKGLKGGIACASPKGSTSHGSNHAWSVVGEFVSICAKFEMWAWSWFGIDCYSAGGNTE